MSSLLFNRAQEQTRALFHHNKCVEAEEESDDWYATQWFHTNEPPQEIDEITAVQFSRDGEHLALGDRGGRIWIYSTNEGRDRCKPRLPYKQKLTFPQPSCIPDIESSESDMKSSKENNNDENNNNDNNETNEDEMLDIDKIMESEDRAVMTGGANNTREKPKIGKDSNNDSGSNDNSPNMNGVNGDGTNINEMINDMQDKALAYDFYGQFQSHQPEFDYLKSLEIEERINCISWLRCANNSLSLLAANDKTIKLWKVFEKSMFRRSGMSFFDTYRTKNDKKKKSYFTNNLHLPDIESHDVITAAISRRVFSNGHKFHIHSLDVNPDCETFISCDDLRINLWHFDSPNDHFVLCDLVPSNMENLHRTITCGFLHPKQCNLMAYCTSDAHTYLCDMRQNCQLSSNRLDFYYVQPELERDFFGDIGMSIKCGCFSRGNGDKLITRDYYNTYIWDGRRPDKPIVILPTLPYYSKDLKTLYESDLLFDKFDVCCNESGEMVATGMYNNSLVIADWSPLIENETNLPILHKCELSKQLVFDFQNKRGNNGKNIKNKKNGKDSSNKNDNKNDKKKKGSKMGGISKYQSDNKTMENGNNDIINDNNNNNSEKSNTLNTVEEEKPVSWLNENYFESGNFEDKVLKLSWHPKKDIVAAVNGAALFMYQKL